MKYKSENSEAGKVKRENVSVVTGFGDAAFATMMQTHLQTFHNRPHSSQLDSLQSNWAFLMCRTVLTDSTNASAMHALHLGGENTLEPLAMN
jgi:hypothetical protein